MRRNAIFGLAIILLIGQFLIAFQAPRVEGAVPEPYELYGVAYDETGLVLADGEPIRSFVDGAEFSNKTSVFSRPGYNDGYFDIDTHGNHKTNESDPGTYWIKEGANTNESIMYVWGDMSNNTQLNASKPWLTGVVFKEMHLWRTGLPPQPGNLNAAPAALQPPLIKIQTIVVDSADPPGNPTDYVWLCNPTPYPVDASRFYIQKDVLNNTNGPVVTIPFGESISPYGRFYLDTGDVNWFDPTGDNVKLVWNNTPGPNASYSGNNIIVDRVEFNASTGGTFYWEPGNTIQNDEIAPGYGFQINRSASCGDTNSVMQDFFLQIEGPRQNKKPIAPWPLSLAGISSDFNESRIFHVTQFTNIVLTWTHNDLDVPPNPQQGADVRITTGPGQTGTTVFNVSPFGTTNTTTVTPPVFLSRCLDYYYSVRTRDSEWSDHYAELKFHTNCRPTEVILQSPANLSTVSSPVNLTWLAVTDSDPGDVINYTWQIASDVLFTNIVASGTTQATYSGPQTLPDGDYYWHVNASDGFEDSVWIFLWTFKIQSGINEPPSVSLTQPVGGEYLVGGSNHVITWTASDNETSSDLLVFYVNYTSSASSGMIVGPVQGVYSTMWTLPSIDATDTLVNITVIDGDGMKGWAESPLFAIDSSPPLVSISFAIAGADWSGGSDHDIIWSMVDTVDDQLQVWLNYSSDGGADGYPYNFYSGALATGTQTQGWTLPVIDTTTARIRVTVIDECGFVAHAESDEFTIDSTSPSIVDTSPVGGSVGAGLGIEMQVVFSERVNKSTVEQAFQISPNPGGIVFTWYQMHSGQDILVISHDPFEHLTEYTITLNNTLRDLSDPGNHLLSPLSFSFTTKAPPAPPNAFFNIATRVEVGEAITLDAGGSAGNISRYVWSITDNKGSIVDILEGSPITYKFNEAGRFTVTLTVHDDLTGLSDSMSLEVEAVATWSEAVPTILMISTVATVAAVVGATEIGRLALFGLLLVPIQQRKMKGKEDHETRGMVKAYVLLNPGDTYTDIKMNLGLSNGSLTWHLSKLEKEEVIKSKMRGARRCYYPVKMKVMPENGGRLHDIQKDLLRLVVRDPGKPVSILAEELGVSSQLTLYHVRKLQQKELVLLERKMFKLKVYPRPKRET